MQSLIFFNKEGDNLNFRYNEEDERWEGDLIFHANSDDTFKTAGLYMFERIPSFEYERPGDIYLQKFQLFNEYRFNITGNSYFTQSVTQIELPNIDSTFYSKWIYGNDFEKKFPIGTQVIFDKQFLEFSNLNQSYTVVKTKKNAIMIMSNLDNRTFNEKFGALVNDPIILQDITISGVNSIGVYNYIKPDYTDNLSAWSEPDFYDKYFDGKVINLINTELNDGIYTVKNYLLNDKVYRRYELDARFLTQSYDLLLDVTLKTELPTVYIGSLGLTSSKVLFGGKIPKILKPGTEFFLPSATINTNALTVDNIPKFTGINKTTYFATSSQVLYDNNIYECRNAYTWTATSSILPNNTTYWGDPTYLPVKSSLEIESFLSTEIQLTNNRFTYSQSFTQSINVTLGSSVEKYREDLRFFNIDYYYENKRLYLDLLYPSNYVEVKIYIALNGSNYEDKTIVSNVYEQNVQIEEILKPEINENICENFSYNIVFTDIDEFGIRLTINGQIYYQEVEFIYDSLDINLERTIDKTLRNWMTSWYLQLALTGVIPKLKFTGKDYSYYLNTIQLTTEYPNVPLVFNVEVGTTANYYLQRAQVIFNNVGTYFSITVNDREYTERVTLFSNGTVDYLTTMNNWVENYSPILEGYGIYVDAVLSMITFDVKEQDTRFEISVNTGASSLPGNDSYIYRNLFGGNNGALITSNEIVMTSPTYSFEEQPFATGQLVSVNNSKRPWNNQEYNIEYLGPKDIVLSYQGPFWGTTDPLCNISPFITIALSNGFGATGCTIAPPLPSNSGEFNNFNFSDAFSIKFGATNSYSVNKNFPINDEARFVDLIYLSLVNKIYVFGERLTVINSITGKVETEIKLPNFSKGVSMTFNSFNNYLYCLTDDKMYLVDPLYPKLDHVIDLGLGLVGKRCVDNPDNGDVYVSYNTTKFDIWYYNNFTSTPSKSYPGINTTKKYYNFVYNPSEQDMYVASDDEILRINGSTRTLQDTIFVAGLREDLFYEPTRSSIYLFDSSSILNLNGGEVSQLNLGEIRVSPWLNSVSGVTASLRDVYFGSTSSGYAVGERGTILKTVSAGKNWATQSSGVTQTLRSVHSTTYSLAWAVGERNTIIRTNNGGDSWEILPGPANNTVDFTGVRVIRPNLAILVASNSRIYIGDGNTYQSYPQTQKLNSIWSNTTGSLVYVVGDSGYISTLNALFGTPPVFQNIKTTLLSSKFKVSATDNVILVGGENGVLLSTTDGTNWYTRNPGVTSSNINSIYFVDNTDTGWLVGSGGLISKSTNNGLSWTKQTSGTPNDLNSVHFSSTSFGLAVGNSGTILFTENGSLWTAHTNLSSANWTSNNLNGVYVINERLKFVVGNSGTILGTDESRFRRVRTVTSSGVFASASYGQTFNNISQTNATSNVWGGGSGAIFNFTVNPNNTVTINSYVDRGKNFVGGDKITISGFNSSSTNDYIELNVSATITEYYLVTSGTPQNLNDIHFSGASGYIVGDGGMVLRTSNSGTSWQIITSPGSFNLLTVYFVSTSSGWVGGAGGRIWRTDNFGSVWSQQTISTTGNITSISFKDFNNGICCDSNGKFFRTTNGGGTWTSIEFNLTDVHFFDSNRGWIVGDNGIMLRTTNGGTKWDYVHTGTTASLTSVDFPDPSVGIITGKRNVIRRSLQGGINGSWLSEDKGFKDLYSVYMMDTNNGFAVGDGGIVYKAEEDPPFTRNLLFNNIKNEMVLSTTEGITTFDLEGNLVDFGITPEYGPLAINQFDGDIYLASQNSQQLFVFDSKNFTFKHSETFAEGRLRKLIYNPDRQSIFGIIPNDIIQVQSLIEISVTLGANLETVETDFVEVGENNYGTLDPNYVKHPDLWFKTREYIRKPRENYNDEPFVDLIVKWEDDQLPDIFLYDFSGDQLTTTGQLAYIGEKPLPLVSLNKKENTKPDRVMLSEFQKTIFDELIFSLDHVDSETNFITKPTPIEIFIGMNSQDEGVISKKLEIYKREDITFTVFANSTNSDVIGFSFDFSEEDGLYGMVVFDLNSRTNFRQDSDGVSRGLKPGQFLKITITDDSNEKNKYISNNSGITVKILRVFTKYLVVSFIDRLFTNEFTQIDDYPSVGRVTYLTVKFEVIDKMVAQFNIKSQTEIEDIRYKIELANSGHLIDPYDTFIFKTYDINEQGIDWNFLNKKRKEMLMVRDQIFPYVGSYKAIINAINFFGYNDLELYEYYRNINLNSRDFYKLFKVEIPDIFDNSVPGWKENDFIKHTLPNPNFEETNLFNLTYKITDKEGTNVLLYSLAEVIMKLQGLKIWLEKKVIPITHRILDITGRADFVGVDTIQHRNYDTKILNIKQSFTPVDFNLDEAYLMPINSGSTVYTCQVNFFMGYVPTYSVAPDYFTVRIRTYKTYKEWDPFFTYQIGDRITYYDTLYESVIPNNRLKNPRKYSGVSPWSSGVDYQLGQYAEYRREIYQYIGTQSSFLIFGSASTVNPFIDIQNNMSFASWFYMTEWKVMDLLPVQNLLEYRTVATFSLGGELLPGQVPPPIKAGHSYNFTVDSNIDPFIVIEVTSDNGYGQNYTAKKNYEIRGLNDLSGSKTQGDPIGPFQPVIQHTKIITAISSGGGGGRIDP
jgi:photosystem II stability/assembly factor-like uncharacterized protein